MSKRLTRLITFLIVLVLILGANFEILAAARALANVPSDMAIVLASLMCVFAAVIDILFGIFTVRLLHGVL